MIPQAWTSALTTLVQLDPISNIYAAWPTEQPAFNSGDAVYWRNLPLDVLKSVGDVEVWPVVGESAAYASLGSALVAHQKSDNVAVHRSLAKALLKIVEVPEYLINLLPEAQLLCTTLTPQSAHAKLIVSFAF